MPAKVYNTFTFINLSKATAIYATPFTSLMKNCFDQNHFENLRQTFLPSCYHHHQHKIYAQWGSGAVGECKCDHTLTSIRREPHPEVAIRNHYKKGFWAPLILLSIQYTTCSAATYFFNYYVFLLKLIPFHEHVPVYQYHHDNTTAAISFICISSSCSLTSIPRRVAPP